MVKNEKLFRGVRWVSVLIIILASCTSNKPQTQDEVLQAMNLNKDTFSKMTICQQIRTYTDFGLHYLDIDHMVAITPDWMDITISRDPKDDVAQCISDEGFYRLGLLASQFVSKEEGSFAIHALVYKADELKLFNYPQIQTLFNTAVCKNDLDYSFELILIYYANKYRKPPPYINQKDEDSKMKAELCNQ